MKQNKRWITSTALLAAAAFAGLAQAETILIDFGRGATEATPKVTTATGWNNITAKVGNAASNTTSVDNTPLKDSDGNTTGVSASISAPTAYASASGSGADINATSLTSPTGISYPTTAFQDSFYTQTGISSTLGKLTVTLSGLNPLATYDLHFFGQGGSAGTSQWAVTGDSTETVTLNVAGDLDFASVLGLAPDATNEITIVFNNTIDAGRWNTLEIVQVPEPSSLALLALGGLLIARRRRD